MKNDVIANETIATNPAADRVTDEKTDTLGRREALRKIGKFTAYTAPAGIAMLSSKAAHAS